MEFWSELPLLGYKVRTSLFCQTTFENTIQIHNYIYELYMVQWVSLQPVRRVQGLNDNRNGII